MDFIRSLAAFIIVLGVLVFVHELGHYLAARWRGVHAEVFSIGFGKAFASWTDRRGTVWKLAWIPLGGYVKMHGQERPQDVSDAERARWMEGRTYQGKSVLSRAIIIAAGPVANFLLAIVLFSILIGAIGRPVAVKGAVFGSVVAGSAAERANLQVGDRVETIDGAPVPLFTDLQRIVSASPDKTLSFQIVRAGQQQTVAVTPSGRDLGGQRIGTLGVSTATEFEPVSPLQAIGAGAVQTWDVTAGTAAALGQIVTGRRGTAELGGPIKIAQLSGQFAAAGVASFIGLIALLSVNLGLFNLLPIPVLDGGHLVFLGAEALAGRPVPQRAQEYGFRAGAALLAGLILFVTWNDLVSSSLGRWVSGLIG
jgi:regulator of sigma E protease